MSTGTRIAAVGMAVALSACASVRTAQVRSGDLQRYFDAHPYPGTCDALWPTALKMVAARGFPLSARDAKIAGEEGPGPVGDFVSAGTQTYRAGDGGLLTSTDWNRQSGTRYRIACSPVGEKGSRFTFDVIGGGQTGAEEFQLGPDWEMNLELLRQVDPAAAAVAAGGTPAGR
jgi:hypothetical protein